MFRRLAVALLAVAAWAAPGLSDTYGPPFGANSYSTSIDNVNPLEDADDFVAPLVAGEKLTVTVTASPSSPLLPILNLVAPDGTVSAPVVVEKKGGTTVTLNKFEIPSTGIWAVRVAGRNGTQGAYTISFKVVAAPESKLTKQHLGGSDPLTRDVIVEGIDGALLDVTVTWGKGDTPVHIGAVRDPAGAIKSAGATPVDKNGSSKLTGLTLHAGDGPYTVTLSIPAGESTYKVTTKVTPKARPKSKSAVAVSPNEPFLAVRGTQIRGDTGLIARLSGSGFPTNPVPQVFFGGVPGTNVAVTPDGTTIDVVVPAGTPGSVVDVAVVQADGQASVRTGYFFYVPMPTISDIRNATNQYDPGGPRVGGEALTLVGTGFTAGQVVRFGIQVATSVVVVDPTHITLVTPPNPVGFVSVTLEDEFFRIATSPFSYEYKLPPAFAAAPYAPFAAPLAGGTTITITGSEFEPTDQLFFDGVALASTFVNSTTRTFVTPAKTTGGYSVRLVDRFGLSTTGPNFQMKDPPAFAASPYAPVYSPTAGGVTITITGSAFESVDQLQFNGVNRTSTYVNATTRTFVTPALATGLYSVSLTDRLGTVVAGPVLPIKDPPAFAANPYSPLSSPTAGGATITITGSNFEAQDQLRFNGSNITSTFVNATTRRFVTPAMATGAYSLSLIDRFGLVGTGPNLTFKDPPTFAATPYSPIVATTAGGTTVTITGTNFEVQDQLRFNGADISSTFVNSTTRRFVTSLSVAGNYPVALVDRFGAVANGPTFPIKDPPAFASTPYSPPYGAVAGGTTVTITGSLFESTDQLRFNGANITSTFLSATSRRFVTPAIAAGSYTVSLIDRFGTVANGPNFTVQGAPTITSVTATAGPRTDSTHIAAGGGATITVAGTGFVASNTATLGGVSATITSQTSTQIRFTAPAGAFGVVTTRIADLVGQFATSNALTNVGFGNETGNRSPGTTSTDNLLSRRGAIGDLDNDGAADDLVITSNYNTNYSYYPLGSRREFTRLFFGGSSRLTDVTSSRFPTTNRSNGDRYQADAISIGDLDGDSDQDILIASRQIFTWSAGYYSYYYLEGRLFTNDGSGTFSLSTYSPRKRTSAVTLTNSYGGSYYLYRQSYGSGNATALAIGDLDSDGDADFVMASDRTRRGAVYSNPAYVTFTPGAYYDANAYSHRYTYTYYSYNGNVYTYARPRYQYTSATRVFDNQGYSGFLDVTFPRVPLCGSSNYASYSPAFPGRDIKLGDIDGDAAASLDMVVTWDSPNSTTPYGMRYGNDSARVATQILINDGYGFFSDQTSSWMPSGSSPEFWQGNRVELIDLDNDGANDLVILSAQTLSGGSSSTRALRILQNTGSSFTDVSSSALPTVPLSGTADDNLRGSALAVRDVDGDGNLDILVGTTEALTNSSGNAVRRTRLLRGDGALHFAISNDFLPLTSVDTGESRDILLGDITGNSVLSLILLTESTPSTSPSSERLRVWDWK